MKKVTIDQIMEQKPCEEYPRERVEELFSGREELTAMEVLDLEIPFLDRLWVFVECGLLSGKDLRLFACDCAESVLPLFERKHPDDRRPREAISVARRYAMGEATKEELSAAYAAAWSTAHATWSSARSAAWYAAWSAAWSARSAARYAAWSAAVAAWSAAASYAASYAAGGCTGEEEQKKQEEMLRKIIK